MKAPRGVSLEKAPHVPNARVSLEKAPGGGGPQWAVSWFVRLWVERCGDGAAEARLGGSVWRRRPTVPTPGSV